jgi:hypothetical protein
MTWIKIVEMTQGEIVEMTWGEIVEMTSLKIKNTGRVFKTHPFHVLDLC